MAISSNSYASLTDVAALVQIYAPGGLFTSQTLPTLTAVESFIDDISEMLNTVLEQFGFTTPVSNARAKKVLDRFVAHEAADTCSAANQVGRLADRALEGRFRFTIQMQDAIDFLTMFATGLENLGATRDTGSLVQGLDFNSADAQGEAIVPVFDQKWMGNRVIDWDPA